MIGATLFIEGHAFTVAGVTPPGFFGETLRGDPPDLWIPLQQEPLINGDTLDPPAADFGMAAGDRPAASGGEHRRSRRAAHRPAAPVDPARVRLPGELDAGRDAGDAPAGDCRRAGRRRRGRDARAVQPQPADPARRVRPGAAHRLRQRREPAARACGRAAVPDRAAARHRRVAPADRHAGARRERAPRHRRRRRRPRWSRWAPRGCCCRWRSRARSSCRSTRVPRRWCWRLRRRSRSSPASSLVPFRRGSRRAPIRWTRCAAPAAARAIARR